MFTGPRFQLLSLGPSYFLPHPHVVLLFTFPQFTHEGFSGGFFFFFFWFLFSFLSMLMWSVLYCLAFLLSLYEDIFSPTIWSLTNLDSVLASRDIILLTKVRLVKAMVFPVVMYRCERCTIKKAESWRTDAFEFWSWRRLSRALWTARGSNQSILKQFWIFIGRTDAEAMILWLMQKRWLIGKDPDAEKDWGQEEKGTAEDEMVAWHHPLNGHE